MVLGRIGGPVSTSKFDRGQSCVAGLELTTIRKDNFGSHSALHQMLIQHKVTIHKCWTKRTRQQKLKVLEAWQGLLVFLARCQKLLMTSSRPT